MFSGHGTCGCGGECECDTTSTGNRYMGDVCECYPDDDTCRSSPLEVRCTPAVYHTISVYTYVFIACSLHVHCMFIACSCEFLILCVCDFLVGVGVCIGVCSI